MVLALCVGLPGTRVCCLGKVCEAGGGVAVGSVIGQLAKWRREKCGLYEDK